MACACGADRVLAAAQAVGALEHARVDDVDRVIRAERQVVHVVIRRQQAAAACVVGSGVAWLEAIARMRRTSHHSIALTHLWRTGMCGLQTVVLPVGHSL